MDPRDAAHPGPVEAWEPLGDSAVLARHAQALTRVDAVAPDILRVRFSPGGRLAPRRSWDPVTDLPPAPLAVRAHGARLRLASGALTASLDLATGAFAFATPAGTPFADDLEPPAFREMDLAETALVQAPDPELPQGRARTALFLHKRMHPEEAYFGFGQRTGRLDRRHRRLTDWTVDRSSPGHSRGNDNLYQAHPCFLAVKPGLAWGLFLHSTWYSGCDAGAAREDVLTLFTLGGELDYYLLAGPTPAAVVEQLTRLTGRPALPPLWALGYHQSRWSYGSDAEVRAVAAGFRERGLPLDAIHLDIDYMDGFRVFTWERTRFPDPAATVAALHAQDIRVVAIVDPGVKKDLDSGYPVAREGLAQGHFVRTPEGEPFTGYVWPGESLFPDFCRAETRRWWGDLHAGLVGIGVDGIWCDMNEPAIVDRPFGTRGVTERPIPLAAPQGDPPAAGAADAHTGDGPEGPGESIHAETHNLYGLLMARAAHEGLARLRPDRRPWVLTRSGYLGVQRWAASWMGDNSAWWEHLEMSLPQLASMGLSGSPQVGVDIGGFYHNCWGELFARWIELGAFYPFMRGHSHCKSRPQEPWAFGPEVERIAREALGLRYRLLPYLYTLAHRAHRTGEPWLRPLLYDFPAEARLHQIEDQVMIGPSLMIAPVCQPGVRRRLVELPPGAWYDFRTGRPMGPGPLVAEAPLGGLPVYVRAGSVLTLGNPRRSTAEPLTDLTLEVYPRLAPGSGEGAAPAGPWTLIEDDGETLAYRDGALAETDLTVETPAGGQDHSGPVLRIGPRRGGWQPAPRTLTVRIHLPAVPAGLLLDGRKAQRWHWDASLHAAELGLPDDAAAHCVQVL